MPKQYKKIKKRSIIDNSLSRVQVFRWHKMFSEGQDGGRWSGCSLQNRTLTLNMWKSKLTFDSRMIAQKLYMNRDVVRFLPKKS